MALTTSRGEVVKRGTDVKMLVCSKVTTGPGGVIRERDGVINDIDSTESADVILLTSEVST